MFPVKWNKLQLRVEINFVACMKMCCFFVGPTRLREQARGLNTVEVRRNFWVEAMEHRESPWFASTKTSSKWNRGKFLARFNKEKWKLFSTETSCAACLSCYTQVYFVQSVREVNREKFSSGEKVKKILRRRKKGKMLWGMENEISQRRNRSVVEVSVRKETWRYVLCHFSLPWIVYPSIESPTEFKLRWQPKRGNDNQLNKTDIKEKFLKNAEKDIHVNCHRLITSALAGNKKTTGRFCRRYRSDTNKSTKVEN